MLYVAAAVVRAERWRFNYGMKLTPARIAGFPLPRTESLLRDIRKYIEAIGRIEKVALSEIVEDRDIKSAEGDLNQSGIEELPATLESTFRMHAENWHAATQHSSSLTEMLDHPSYRAIVMMGAAAIPLILRELEARPDYWFAALTRITGDNLSKDLDFNAAVRAWLDWGKKNRYLEDRP
jgi:hypothetical protein